ncbi:alpha/beta hydrolase [Yeosuana sp. MJ-SS3]|uniref:Alpha/beta hydrolase n=1 Tax=Gilvirhabdus luticola TaxID=3079858 RepID=A0ABU3U593_9FLAO|nr:alpha/beta hydrolase [Yeosuana sp. MJ-SS3]MDU8885572.1 alpha/beta hydrolase [Yeosuana sp. MJ-SS3]
MKLKFLIFSLLFHVIVFSQEKQFVSTDISINKFIEGTLLIPNDNPKPDLAIIIGDSGPTDRNGNQNFLKNYSLKKLAEALSKNGIATFRYDKRIVKQIRNNYLDKNIVFDDFVTDAISVIDYFKTSNTYNKIFVIGHGQGSLVGMLASREYIDGFISIAGAGQSIDNVIIEQIEKTAPMFTEDAKKVFMVLKNGQTTSNYPEALSSIFKEDIQTFMSNWMRYNPQEEIKKLSIPVLIINGTKDLQVSVEEATLLESAANQANLKIIDNMNHIMFIIDGDDLENSKSYNESFRSVSRELIETVVTFLN